MQKFTKTEISLIANELAAQASFLEWRGDHCSKQYYDISRRLRLAFEEDDKQIEIE